MCAKRNGSKLLSEGYENYKAIEYAEINKTSLAMHLEHGGSGKNSLHVQFLKNGAKYNYDKVTGKFIGLADDIQNSPIIKKGVGKAFRYLKSRGWKL